VELKLWFGLKNFFILFQYSQAIVYVKDLRKKMLEKIGAQKRWGRWKRLATHYLWEDIFWQRKEGRKIPWLEKEIRL